MSIKEYYMENAAGCFGSTAVWMKIRTSRLGTLVGIVIMLVLIGVGCELGTVSAPSTSGGSEGSITEEPVDPVPNDDIDDDGVANDVDVDDDGDGLIEIHDLVMLNAIRHDLDGRYYDDEADDGEGNEGDATGCPSAGCRGYELVRSLDFADDGSYPDGIIESAWRPNQGNLGAGDNAGWEPINDGTSNPFGATFDGNGHTISNLYIRAMLVQISNQNTSGLFSKISFGATVRNLRLEDANVHGKPTADNMTGILVGQNTGTIVSVHVTGNVYGKENYDGIGGLAGENQGTITGSSAIAQVYGGGRADYVGGLVGENLGDIVASFSSGAVYGGEGNDYVGGLAGSNSEGVIGNYSQSAVYGDEGNDGVGGLLGMNEAYVAANYATGNSDGGNGGNDAVGGLVGYNYGTITANYATGEASNGTDLGALIGNNGLNPDSGIHYSHAFGTPTTALGRGSGGTVLPTGVTGAAYLSDDPDTDEYVGSAWNDADNYTLNAWDFRDPGQAPVLRYSDYDGSSTVYRCAGDANNGRFIVPNCGTVLAGQ